MCADRQGSDEPQNGECPDCGAPTHDGESLEICGYSPTECQECGYAPCDGSC